MELADPPFARVVAEAAALGAEVERGDGASREGAVAHRGDVEEGCRVRLRALGSPDHRPRSNLARVHREHGMARPLIPFGVGPKEKSVGAI